MASFTPNLRNGITPSRTTSPCSDNPHPELAELGAQLLAANPPEPPAELQKRIIMPTRYTALEPPQPLSAFIDDPVFNTRDAAAILGVSFEQMKKWRQRHQGPDYYQYDYDGPVRYALSALNAFKAAHIKTVARKKGAR